MFENPTGYNQDGMAQYGTAASSQHVKFYSKELYLPLESEREGRPVYITVPHIHILTPGEKDDFDDWVKFENSELEAKGLDKKGYCQRYPQQWAAFKNNQEAPTVGTPIDKWPNPSLDAGRVAELKAVNIRTVEQLAAIKDSALPELGMGGNALRKQAQAWLEAAKGGAAVNQLTAENKRLHDEVEALKEQFRTFTGDEPKEAPKRRGRPKGSKNKVKPQIEEQI